MAIQANTRKGLRAGTRLVARYKQQDHAATVVTDTEGRLRYRLPDGREFKSPSAAGSAVMGGISCNGWRFWSVDESAPASPQITVPGAIPLVRPSCPRCGKTMAGRPQLEHHEANAARLCKPPAPAGE